MEDPNDSGCLLTPNVLFAKRSDTPLGVAHSHAGVNEGVMLRSHETIGVEDM